MSELLVLTPGMGIGPEVTLRALENVGSKNVVLVGRRDSIRAVPTTLELVDITDINDRLEGTDRIGLLDPGDRDEPCEVASIRLAAEACLSGDADGMVTGPIHKARLRERGFQFMGHTDFLGDICNASPVMGFVGGSLRVVLVTTHAPLADISRLVTKNRVSYTVRTAHSALVHSLGLVRPKIAICGLNPHAGEGGLLGSEDSREILPAVRGLQEEGIDCRGPMGAESAFLAAMRGEFDLVVAMYHDQGLAPLKAVDFGRSVNWSMGLPILRVSVDHGTADDLVGKQKADPGSMESAIALARSITSSIPSKISAEDKHHRP